MNHRNSYVLIFMILEQFSTISTWIYILFFILSKEVTSHRPKMHDVALNFLASMFVTSSNCLKVNIFLMKNTTRTYKTQRYYNIQTDQ